MMKHLHFGRKQKRAAHGQRVGTPIGSTLQSEPQEAHTPILLESGNLPNRVGAGLGSAAQNVGNGKWTAPVSTSMFTTPGARRG